MSGPSDITVRESDWIGDLTDALLDTTMAPPQQQAPAALDRTFNDATAAAGIALTVENASCDNEANAAWVEFHQLRASWTANKGVITR